MDEHTCDTSLNILYRETMNNALVSLTRETPWCVESVASSIRDAYKFSPKECKRLFRGETPRMKAGICFLLSLTEEDAIVKQCLMNIAVEAKSMINDTTFTRSSQVPNT